ncbi:MAG TPA: hypothetical protein DDZ51_14460 [Planctomycetaceae bacterium]|nr:hypothetical protein [Planctomycetaceae bacterium]
MKTFSTNHLHSLNCRVGLLSRRSLLESIGSAAVFAFFVNFHSAQAVEVVPVSNQTPVLGTAPSFRVEIEIFEGTQVKPQSQHLLLFDSGVIYDLPIGVGTTVTVFDPSRTRVMLLHKTQRVRTTISTESLIQISAQARSAAIDARAEKSLGLNARVAPAGAAGDFAIEFGDTKYSVKSQPTLGEGVAAEFAAFTVWACRLNLARQVGSPPFARMTMAEFLAAEKVLPRQISLEVRRGLKTRTYRAEHLYVGRLSDLDRKKITDVGQMIASYEEVEFAEFPVD